MDIHQSPKTGPTGPTGPATPQSGDVRQSYVGATGPPAGPPGPLWQRSLESFPELRREWASSIRPELLELLGKVDGAAQLVSTLPKLILPAEAASPGRPQREWELCGLCYLTLILGAGMRPSRYFTPSMNICCNSNRSRGPSFIKVCRLFIQVTVITASAARSSPGAI